MFCVFHFWRRWRWRAFVATLVLLLSPLVATTALVIYHFGYRFFQVSIHSIPAHGALLLLVVKDGHFPIADLRPRPRWLASRSNHIGYGPLGSEIYDGHNRLPLRVTPAWSEADDVPFWSMPREPGKAYAAVLPLRNVINDASFWLTFIGIALSLGLLAGNCLAASEAARRTYDAFSEALEEPSRDPEQQPIPPSVWDHPVRLLVRPALVWVQVLFGTEAIARHFRRA